MQKLPEVLAEPEEGSRRESENLFKTVTWQRQGNISALSRRSMKLKGSLNYRDETALRHHLDAPRNFPRSISRLVKVFSKS